MKNFHCFCKEKARLLSKTCIHVSIRTSGIPPSPTLSTTRISAAFSGFYAIEFFFFFFRGELPIKTT